MKTIEEMVGEAITNPIAVALTLPLTWVEGDILPEELVNARLEQAIASYKEDEPESVRTWLFRNPQFYARKMLSQDKSWEYAESQGWINSTSYHPETSKFIVLRRIDEGEFTHSLAVVLAREFDLPTDFAPPECMWDCLCTRRVSEEFVLALCGDDRDCDEGSYFLCLSYCHQEIDQAFFPNALYCGAF